MKRNQGQAKAKLTECLVNEEAVRSLVRHIIPCGSDEAAKALTTLINAVAYGKDQCVREDIAMYACNEAYRDTMSADAAERAFRDQAAAEFPVAA